MQRQGFEQFTELAQFEVDAPSVKLLSESFCRRHEVVVLGRVNRNGNTPITLGVVDPRDRSVGTLVAERLLRPIQSVRLNRFEINHVLERIWPSTSSPARQGEHRIRVGAARPRPDAKPSELVDDVILHALSKGASDIHIESYPGDVDVRLRIDGMLRQLPTSITPDNLPAVINRIKVMAKLDITERRAPQDGRFRAEIIDGNKQSSVDFRVSMLPGLAGEDAVLRILDTGKGLVPIDQLGMPDAIAIELRRLIANPEGLVLVTGPTGSGKTTTLYASLLEVQCSTRKVLTAEDPIEYFIPKLNQKQTSPQASMADLARAFLRQDPDVILIGEVRDEETAIAASKAATTGHLVLSTLHTNDALGVVPRLRGLGLSNDILADALLGSLNQRLIRRVCLDCKRPSRVREEHQRLFGKLLNDAELSEGVGCGACFGSGYRGRVGLFEFLLFDRDLQDLVSNGKSVAEIRRALKEKKHRTLIDDGLDKVRQGTTTLDGFLRVVPLRTVLGALR
jgi:type II secretory ATPase GspE/PulE/Tfp pilus assembly ATPase PilB-like protein